MYDTPSDEHSGLCHDLAPNVGNQGWWQWIVATFTGETDEG